MRRLATLLGLALLAGCTVPTDPEGTLERVRGGTLRVGVSAAEPWVLPEEDPPRGVEPRLVQALAQRLAARVEWVEGSEAELIAALHERELDLVVGGLTKDTPWQKEVAISRPYVETRIVVGLPEGRRAAKDLEGVEVLAERGTEAIGLVEDATAARVTPTDDLRQARGRAAVVDEWLLDDLDLQEARELKVEQHVIAAAPGENAWLMELDRFLLRSEALARHLLEEEGRP